MKDKEQGDDFELVQIEADLLYSLPEPSFWLYYRACQLMTQAVAKAVVKVDLHLPEYRWFREVLSLIVRGPLTAADDGLIPIDDDRAYVRESLRNIVTVLREWQCKSITVGGFDNPFAQCVLEKITIPTIRSYDEEPGDFDNIIESLFFRKTETCLSYHPGPLADVYKACCPNPVEMSEVPRDVMEIAARHDIFFIEENDMGWFDEDRDNFMSQSISKIYSERHPKKDEPTSMPDVMAGVLKSFFDGYKLQATITGISKEGGRALRQAMKDKGGPTPKVEGAPKKLTQGDVARLFGPRCNKDKVANWEAYNKSGGKRGSTPPCGEYNGEDYSYTQELRTNPTPENVEILGAIAKRYQETAGVQDGIEADKFLHTRSAEARYRAEHRGCSNP